MRATSSASSTKSSRNLCQVLVLSAGVADHVRQLRDAVVGQRGDGFVGAGIDADDVAVGQIIVVRDDGFEKFDVLAQHSWRRSR